MRNIHDIIAEQKYIVDVNIAKYDLDYTINQLVDNDYYVQEGLGESVKNALNKVIDDYFLNKVIKNEKNIKI